MKLVKDFSVEDKKLKQYKELNAKILGTDLEFLLLKQFMDFWHRSCGILSEIVFAYALGEYFFAHTDLTMGDFRTLMEQRGCCQWMIVWYLPYLMDVEEDLNRSVDFFRIFDYIPGINNVGGKEIP